MRESRQVFAINPEKNNSPAPHCAYSKASSTELDELFDEMHIWDGYEDDEDEESGLVNSATTSHSNVVSVIERNDRLPGKAMVEESVASPIFLKILLLLRG